MVTKVNTPEGPVPVVARQSDEATNVSEQAISDQFIPRVPYPWAAAPRAINPEQEPTSWFYDEFEEDWACDDGNQTIWWHELEHELFVMYHDFGMAYDQGPQQTSSAPQTPEKNQGVDLARHAHTH